MKTWSVGLVIATAACSGPDERTARCDSSGDSERYAWLVRPQFDDSAHGSAPHDMGLRIDDECARTLRQVMTGCGRDFLRDMLDGVPVYKSALRVGFTRFTCEEAGTGTTTSFALPELLEPPAKPPQIDAGQAGPPAPAPARKDTSQRKQPAKRSIVQAHTEQGREDVSDDPDRYALGPVTGFRDAVKPVPIDAAPPPPMDAAIVRLTREQLTDGLALIADDVRTCKRDGVHGLVKLRVTVLPSGVVGDIERDVDPDRELSACVEAAVRKAKFPATTGGGSVVAPFGF